MPKALCLASLVVSAVVGLLFLADIVSGVPFAKAGGMLVDLTFVVAAGGVGTYSWLTFLEQK